MPLLGVESESHGANIQGESFVFRTTAEDLLFRLLPPESVDALYVLFPDPWPKKRHHKRRLVTPEVTAAMVRCLKPGAPLLVKSDHPAYAEVIAEVLSATTGLKSTDAAAAFEDVQIPRAPP